MGSQKGFNVLTLPKTDDWIRATLRRGKVNQIKGYNLRALSRGNLGEWTLLLPIQFLHIVDF